MESSSSTRKNPSRETCQKIIKRILVTEVLEKGKNTSFRSAADFMNYFQSLYLPSDSLTKQVQRAVKAMNMPKDEHGYFIINKTNSQVLEEQEMKSLSDKYEITLEPEADFFCECESIFLRVPPTAQDYFASLLRQSTTFGNRIVTIVSSTDGLILYTKEKQRLLPLLQSLFGKKE